MVRFPPRRILVCADLCGSSLSALRAAKALALRWRAALEVVHVRALGSDFIGTAPDMPLVTTVSSWPWKDRRPWRESAVRKLLAGFPAASLEIREIPGWPPRKLAELAAGRSADLVILGTHGYAGLDRALFGSVAEGVVRRAHAPVLVVHRRPAPLRVRRVLAPWNGAPYATRALLYARQAAKSLGARLEVLHVAPWELSSGAAARLRRRVERLLGSGGPAWTFRLRRGEARHVILEEAVPKRADLVVLAAHRRPFSADFLLGSTVERVLRHSRVAMLAVPSEAPRRPRRRMELPPEYWLTY